MSRNITIAFCVASLVALFIMWVLPSPQFYYAAAASLLLAVVPKAFNNTNEQ
jgi:hypothetical protein